MYRASLLLIALASCYGPTVPEGRPCSETKECPAPQVCDVGTCRSTATVDSAIYDAMFDGPRDALEIDAAIDSPGPPVCAPPLNLGTFSVPLHLATLGAAGDDGTPTVTTDYLEMYFKSERAGGMGGGDIWRTTRSSTTAPWSAPTNVTQLNAAADDGSPELSADRLTIYISSARAGGLGNFDIWKSTRVSTTSSWSTPVNVPELSSAAYEEGFSVGPSGLVGYLHSTRAAFASQLFRTTRVSTNAPWGTPVLIAELSTTAEENPLATPDDCALYFQSLRAGGVGGNDLWVSTRPTPTGTWGTPVVVPGVNSSTFDGDVWISADQRRIVFASARTGNTIDLHEASR